MSVVRVRQKTGKRFKKSPKSLRNFHPNRNRHETCAEWNRRHSLLSTTDILRLLARVKRICFFNPNSDLERTAPRFMLDRMRASTANRRTHAEVIVPREFPSAHWFSMRVRIVTKKIHEFIQRYSDSEASLLSWVDVVEKADWSNPVDLKATFNSVDPVGRCTVFNVAKNRYRLIARVNYRSKRVFVLFILTHKEYDARRWEEKCRERQ
jgi:mRNA interferase HigB